MKNNNNNYNNNNPNVKESFFQLDSNEDYETIPIPSVVNPAAFATLAYDALKQASESKINISRNPKIASRQVELFERNLNPRNTLRFNESKTGEIPSTEVKQGLNQEGGGNFAPVALRQTISNNVPVFVESSPGTIRVQHREMIGKLDGVAADDFSMSFRIQPANTVTFPWLSNLANMFETYTFHYLRIMFVPRLPTSTAGQVGLALDFDADDAPATTLSQFSQYQHSAIGSVWAALSLTAEGDALVKCVRERYTDHNLQPHTYDPILHDVANLRVAVLTTPAEVLGELFVEYDITLRTPEPSPLVSLHTGATLLKFVVGGSSSIGKHEADGYTCFGRETPTVTTTKSDVPVAFKYSGFHLGHEFQILEIGEFLVQIILKCPNGTMWDDVTKSLANTKGSMILVGHAGVSVVSTFPISSTNLCEVATDNSYTYLSYQAHIRVTDIADSWWYIMYTPSAGAGLTTTTTVHHGYIFVERYTAGGMPALQSKQLPTLTKIQASHPLGTVPRTLDSKTSRRAVYSLANILDKTDLPSFKKIKKSSPIKSTKRNRKKPNSKKK